jgi:penicillin-binding protein-related factor A (putative recombinase)
MLGIHKHQIKYMKAHKTGGAIGFALIFLLLFASRQKVKKEKMKSIFSPWFLSVK